MMSDVKCGALYRHFKGGLYRVCGFATHTETGENLVIYHNVEEVTVLWARPIEMFCEIVGDKPRFKKVNEEDGENHAQDT